MKQTVKLLTLFVFSVLFGHSGFAQNHILGLGEYIDYANIDRNINRNMNTYENISGSPFMFPNFKQGQILLKDGKIYEGPLRYDIYANQIEFRTSEGDVFAVKNPETINKVKLGDVQLKYFSANSGNSIDGLFEILVEGKYMLFEKHFVVLNDPVAPKPYVQPKPATFIKRKSEFLVMNPEGVFTVIANKKDLALLNPNKTVQIEKFVKAKKIRITEKKDMTDFVNFLNAE